MSEFWIGPAHAPDTYELVSLLGSGGEGEVWKAILPLSTDGRRLVAVKITPVHTGSAEIEGFGHLLRSLAHPGLVRVTDVFRGPARHRRGETVGANPQVAQFDYVVMDYVDGINLREWIAEHPDAPVSERLRLLGMVAAALDDMHSGAMTEVALAHGDVKPANIVVGADGSATLVDLGLTRLTDTADDVSGHSAAYAAPELRTPGGRCTPASDRYAFAVTTAHLLTGQQPPLGPDGWLDQDALLALLKSNALTARRHQLAQQVTDVLSAPAEARNSPLRPWLDTTIDSLSQITESAPDSGSRPSRAPTPPQGLWRPAAPSPSKPYLTQLRAKYHDAWLKERDTMHPTHSDNLESAPSTARNRRKYLYVMVAILVAALVAGALIAIPMVANSSGSEIFAAPANSAGDNPFARGLTLPQAPPIAPVNTPPTSSGATPSVAGDTPGVYARVQGEPAYDTTELASQIQDSPQKATAFNSGTNTQAGSINSFLNGLQAVYLTSAVRVTYYTYVNGSLVAAQAVLQPTTLVLVDKFGNPVVRVVGGNPLGAPIPVSGTPTYIGQLWPGFNPNSVVAITPTSQPLIMLIAYDPVTGQLFSLPLNAPMQSIPVQQPVQQAIQQPVQPATPPVAAPLPAPAPAWRAPPKRPEQPACGGDQWRDNEGGCHDKERAKLRCKDDERIHHGECVEDRPPRIVIDRKPDPPPTSASGNRGCRPGIMVSEGECGSGSTPKNNTFIKNCNKSCDRRRDGWTYPSGNTSNPTASNKNDGTRGGKNVSGNRSGGDRGGESDRASKDGGGRGDRKNNGSQGGCFAIVNGRNQGVACHH